MEEEEEKMFFMEHFKLPDTVTLLKKLSDSAKFRVNEQKGELNKKMH